MRESIFSFWEDTEFNALTDKPLTAADNAYQAREGEEESWFWEASNEAGAYLNITFTACGKDGKASLFLVQPGMEAVSREAAAPFTATTGKLDLQLDGKRIYQEGELFRLEWQSEDLRIELEFQPLLAGWQPGYGRVDFGEKGDKYLVWSVPVPRARVNGNLVIAGRKTAFSGTGYVDHRRYNFPLPQTLAGAILGRYYGDSYTLLWADLWGNLLYSGKHVTALYLARQGEILASTGNLELQVFEQQRRDNLNYPTELSLKAGTNPPASLDIKEAVPLNPRLSTAPGTASLYCRFKGQLKLGTQPEEEVAGRGVLETLTG